MTEARRDNNGVTTAIGVLDSDGKTPTLVKVDPTTKVLAVSDGATGSDLSGEEAIRDGNGVPTLLGVSSADGKTPVPVYVNSSGEILIKST